MDRAERTAYAGMYLVDALRPVARPVTFDAEGWEDMPAEAKDDIHSPMGFLPPMPIEGEIFAFFCPEIIADRSVPLDDEGFVDLLTWVRFHMMLHFIYGGVEMVRDPVGSEATIGEIIARCDPAAALARLRAHV